ncbi:hypothetical protein D1641_00210 [Colidextribacter sp. OB.20]|nr:hypothetical protein [Colidextribacter sp. OB.20]
MHRLRVKDQGAALPRLINTLIFGGVVGQLYQRAPHLVPDHRKIPAAEITMETRKGVAVSYSRSRIAV